VSTPTPGPEWRLPSTEDAVARLRGTAVGQSIDRRIAELTDECIELENQLQRIRARKKRMEALRRMVAQLTDEQIAGLNPDDPNSWIPVDLDRLR
jgi:hypothetical protein